MSDEKPKKKEGTRIVAAQSFNADEVTCMHEIFTALMRGGDPRVLLRSEAGKNIFRKVNSMKASVERQKIERVIGRCTCTTIETSFNGNPQGHNVNCPRWGTDAPNEALTKASMS